MKGLNIFGWLVFAAGIAAAQPAITVVENSASNIPAGLPNAAIAQGSLFVVKGSGMGPASYNVAGSFPLTTTRAGASVSVTVGGKTVAAIMYYAGSAQLAAILPSSTPVGTGTLTVTYNGKTSARTPVTVTQSNLGIFTVGSSGSGDAIATLGNSLVSASNSPNPGETVAFWGTGLGPVNFDETNAAQQVNMTNIAVQAYVGGKQARIAFQGRNACCTAVDTVYVVIPDGVSGCAVPVIFQTGAFVSNATNIAVAAKGRACVPTTPAATPGDLSAWLSQGTFVFGSVSLTRRVSNTPALTVGTVSIMATTTRVDSGDAGFSRLTVAPGALGLGSSFDITSYGACTVTYYSGVRGATLPPPISLMSLDAGPSIGVSGPNGSKTLTKSTTGFINYSASFDSTGTYLAPGAYTVTGTGGADVGAFTANLTLPPALTWTNQAAITGSPIDRSKGVIVNWVGGDPAGYVEISGSSFTAVNNTTFAFASFTCSAKTTDQTFTVPPVVLLGLPATGSFTSGGVSVPEPGSLELTGQSQPVRFNPAGVDYGIMIGSTTTNAEVTYQ